jgi:hypothetical protein
MARNAADAVGAARPKGEIFQHPRGPEKPLAHRDKPNPAQAGASRIRLSDIVTHLVDAEKFS